MTSSRSMDPLSGESPVGSTGRSLDQVLRLFEQGHMSATEMRVLLVLREHADSSIAELARELGARPAEITRAGRRLAMRGLVRWHYGGRPEHALLEATASGAGTIDALLTTLLQLPRRAGDGARMYMGIDAHSPGDSRRPRCTT